MLKANTRPAQAFASRSVFIGGISAEEAVTGPYLAIASGQRCDCLSLAHRDGAKRGYLVSMYPYQSSGTLKRTRTTIAAKGNGNVMSFGNIIAMRTAEGYTLTTHTRLGRIRQQRFIRTEVQDISSAVARESLSRMHAIRTDSFSMNKAN